MGTLAAMNYFILLKLETSKDERLLYQDRLTKLWRGHPDHMNPMFAAIYMNAFDVPPSDTPARAVLQAALYQFPDPPRRAQAVHWSEEDPLKKLSANGREWATAALPFPNRPAAPFQWAQSPFQLQGESDEDTVHSGVDYLLPFWMGRDAGVIVSEELARQATPPDTNRRRAR
jgi:hypothetical protein